MGLRLVSSNLLLEWCKSGLSQACPFPRLGHREGRTCIPTFTCLHLSRFSFLPFLSLSHTYYTFRHTPSLSYTVPDMLSKGRERKGCLLSMRVAPRQTCWCTVACLFSIQLYCQWGIHSRQVGCRLAKWGISVVRVYLHEVNLCHHRPA